MTKPVNGKKKLVKPKEGRKPKSVTHKDLNKYEDLMRDEDTVLRIMSKCGVDVSSIGSTFKCPLPDHDEQNPSASLWRDEDNIIVFHDWHQMDGVEWYSIPHVFASCTTGKTIEKFNDDWVEPWWARALYESECMDRELPTVPNQTELPLSKDAKTARIFYDALVYRLQLMWLLGVRKNWRKADRFTYFPARFAALWAGMSNSTWVDGKKWLINNVYIEQAILMEVHDTKKFTPPKKSKEEIAKIEGSIFALRLPDKKSIPPA